MTMINFILYNYVLQRMMNNNVATSHGHSIPLTETVRVIVSSTVLLRKNHQKVNKHYTYSQLHTQIQKNAEQCGHQQFHQVWKNYTCNCSSTVETATTSTPSATHNTTSRGVTPTGLENNSVQSSVVLPSLVGILVVLLTVVTIGWVCTCCMIKNAQRKNVIHRYVASVK